MKGDIWGPFGKTSLVGRWGSGGRGGTQYPYIYNTGINSKYLLFHVIIYFMEKRQEVVNNNKLNKKIIEWLQ